MVNMNPSVWRSHSNRVCDSGKEVVTKLQRGDTMLKKREQDTNMQNYMKL